MKREGKKLLAMLRYCLGALGILVLGAIAGMVVLTVSGLILAVAVVCALAQGKGEPLPLWAWVVGFPIYIWLLISPVICLRWVFKPAEWFWWKHKYISRAIGYGSFFGGVAIIAAGIHFLLWFFPDGEIGFQARFCIAGAIGFISTLAIWDKLNQDMEHKWQTDREARIHAKVTQTKGELSRISKYRLENRLAELRKREAELDELWQQDALSPLEQEELLALKRVCHRQKEVADLRRRIEDLKELWAEHKLGSLGQERLADLQKELEEYSAEENSRAKNE